MSDTFRPEPAPQGDHRDKERCIRLLSVFMTLWGVLWISCMRNKSVTSRDVNGVHETSQWIQDESLHAGRMSICSAVIRWVYSDTTCLRSSHWLVFTYISIIKHDAGTDGVCVYSASCLCRSLTMLEEEVTLLCLWSLIFTEEEEEEDQRTFSLRDYSTRWPLEVCTASSGENTLYGNGWIWLVYLLLY